MRFKAVRFLLPVAAIAALGAVVACSGSEEATTLQVSDSANPATVVITMYAGDNGQPSGTAVGTLIAPRLVLTAGHNVAGKASWKIEAVNAKSQKAVGLRGMTYDWKNYRSNKSHPGQSDVAVIELDKPIVLDEYPTLATSPLPEGAQLARVRRDPDGLSLSKSKLKEVTGATYNAKGVGFSNYYFTATESGEAIDSGGALIDPKTNQIYGVVSGKGMTTGALYIARVDAQIGQGWTLQHVACQKKPAGDAGAGTGSGGGAKVDSGGAGVKGGEPTPPPSNCWGTKCGGGGSQSGDKGGDGDKGGETTGGKGGETTGGKGGETTGGKGGETTGGKGGSGGKGGGGKGGNCEGGGKGGGTTGTTGGGNSTGGATGGNTTGGNTTGGNSTGGNTTGGNTTGGNTTGGNSTGGNSTGGNSTGGNSTGGNTTGGNSTGGNSTGGNSTGGNSTGGNSTGGATSGNTTGGATGGNSTGGNSTGGGTTTGTTTGGGTGATTGTTTGGTPGGNCEGPECGGCAESDPNCEDETIDYGDCDCAGQAPNGPIY